MGSLFGLWMPLLMLYFDWLPGAFIYANGASDLLFTRTTFGVLSQSSGLGRTGGRHVVCGRLGFAVFDFSTGLRHAAGPSSGRNLQRPQVLRNAGRFLGAAKVGSGAFCAGRKAFWSSSSCCPLSAPRQVLGWDFQLAAAHNWESSIFAPLYTLSSLLAGLAACILLITVAGGALRGKGFFTSHQYDNVGKVMVGIGLVWTYFRICDFLTAWFGHTPEEWRIQQSRTVYYPVQTGLMLLGCLLLPVFANFFPSLRKRVWLICTTSMFVLIGVGSQRFLDTVPTFSPKFGILPFAPMLPALAVFVGIGGLFVLTYLIAAQIIPILSWWGMSKGRSRMAEHKMGNSTVTMMVEDPPLWET